MKKLTLLLLSFIVLNCQGQPKNVEHSNNPAYVVREIAETFDEGYVFPDIGRKIKEVLLENLDQGKYANLTEENLAKALQEDMFSVCQDKHARIRYNPSGGQPNNQPQSGFFDRVDNYGFSETRIIDGNIGYIKLDLFYPIERSAKAEEVATYAMQQVIDTDAIIFDLRENRGGNPTMLNHLISYLYPTDTTIHLNTFYYRPSNYTSHTYTNPDLPGKRFVDKPVVVLTSSKTFSCGEEFTYDLKHLKRATIIGETTGGGAHPVEPVTITREFTVTLPIARAINPITGTNWEGKGVEPHIQVSSEKALTYALKYLKEIKP